MRRTFRGLAASASLIAIALSLALMSDLAQARQPGETGDVTIDQFAATDGGDKIVFRGVAFVKTSLDFDEVQELLAPTAPADQKLAIVKKLTADSISIASIEITPPDGGVLALTDFQASNVDAAKIGKLSIAGIAGAFRDGSGRMSIKTGAVALEDADFSALLDALSGTSSAPRLRLAHLSLQGVEIVAPDRTGAGEHHIGFESFEIKDDYDGEVIKQGSTALKGLVIEAAPGSELGDFLASLGYLRLELDAMMNTHYDAATKTFSVDQFSIEGAQMGSIVAKADFANVDPVLFKGDDKMTPQALLAAGIAAAEVRLVNTGVVERALAFFAKERKMTPAGLRLEAAAAVIHEAPTLLGASADALNVAIEAQKFIAAPKTFVVTARSKGAPVKWSDVTSAADPRDVLRRVDITAVAGQ